MKKANKNSLLATTQKQGIKNINIIKILACFKENFKYIFFTAFISLAAIYIAEISGRIIAYLIWR